MPPENEAEPQNLRDVLSQAVSDAEAAAPEPTPAREKPVEADSAGAEPREEGRARGPDGKFIQRDAADTVEASVEGVDAAVDQPVVDDASAAAVAPSAEVPQHWSQADKELIAGLPKEHQAKVVERYKAIEAGFTPKLREAAEIRRQYQGAMEIFAPHAEGLRQRGQTPSDVIRAWASIEQDLMQGQQLAAQGQTNIKGAQHVARMIQAYNVDPGVVASILRGETPQATAGNGAAQNGAYVPPEVLQEIHNLRARQDARDAAEARRNEGASQAQIDAFANEKSETGALKHPFFSELESDMMMLARIDISQGKVPSVSDLYDRAVYANRETRAKVLAANSAEAQRKAAAERKAKAEASARASSSVVGSPGSGGSQAERRAPRSLRDEIADAAAEIDAA